MKVTVCTPTYNRAYCLNRPYESLIRQSSYDFVWLVIDDGSTDDTETIINGFKKNSPFKIVYIKKDNGGRASAINESYKHIETEWVINLDSDDELVDDAIENIYRIINEIPKDELQRFWCITGNCIDSQSGNRIGVDWPTNINKLRGKKQYKMISKYKGGEKSCIRKVSILKEHPFPLFKETTFVPENIVWTYFNIRYDQYCVNDVFRIYYTDSSDSLSTGQNMSGTKAWSFYYFSIYNINDYFNYLKYDNSLITSIIGVSRYGYATGMKTKQFLKRIRNPFRKFLCLVFAPIGYFYHLKKDCQTRSDK